ncbi:MAG: NAD(P)H-hydrate dehydratase [Shinella sp.]|nr:NAD(P)H-hydrate dehydratase [Shinella sp.]
MQRTLENLIVTPEEMARIDRDAARSGIDSYRLMEQAGRAVAAAALRKYPQALRFAVLCGPGNNGGDGYVAAAALGEAGAAVAVFSFGDISRLRGDAARARSASGLASASHPLVSYSPMPGDVIIDALFGAGLGRDLPEEVARLIAQATALDLPVVAADLPSGIDGRTGAVRGAAFQAAHTITFMCRKPGHLLMPGRAHCGEIDVVDIGIPKRIVAAASGHLRVNGPDVWRLSLPHPGADAHKYRRGHLAVFSGKAIATGASRLAAEAGLKAGAGLVSVLAPPEALTANAAHLTAVMLKEVADGDGLKELIKDGRLSAFVLGPGFGDLKKARGFAGMLASRRVVLDADGITAFKDGPQRLFEAFSGGEVRLVLTPHDGEFARLFPDLAADHDLSKVDRARKAAERSNGVIVLKGADTVVAAPDGRALINENAPPWLATAGAGDVLAGIIGAHLAQGMPAFEAAAAGVWRHGEAAQQAGSGMTAEDLVRFIRPFR